MKVNILNMESSYHHPIVRPGPVRRDVIFRWETPREPITQEQRQKIRAALDRMVAAEGWHDIVEASADRETSVNGETSLDAIALALMVDAQMEWD
jgi:hypothetical protein